MESDKSGCRIRALSKNNQNIETPKRYEEN